ncbi:MAG: hypothetical protein ACOYMG_00330, partial [Candidatus Methylumidiphilus sp.]
MLSYGNIEVLPIVKTKNWRGSNQGNTFAGIGGKNQESGELLKRVNSSGILAAPKLPLDSDSDDIFLSLRGGQPSFRNPQAIRHS